MFITFTVHLFVKNKRSTYKQLNLSHYCDDFRYFIYCNIFRVVTLETYFGRRFNVS